MSFAAPSTDVYQHLQPFACEQGGVLPNLKIAYCCFGAPSRPVVWVCHALTANADVSDWWANIFGAGKLLDPERYFIVCPNNIGSCYGSTSPLSLNAATGQPYGADFPALTTRDMMRAHRLLAAHLGIERIHLLMGGSQGGQQAMEWAIEAPDEIENLLLLATNARHSAWGIAFNETQRMALRAGGYSAASLAAARAVAMLSYRNYEMYSRTEKAGDSEKYADFGATTYQQHQGDKLARRFDARCYEVLSLAMDSHHVGRAREGGTTAALSRIKAQTLIIGISSDLLFPPAEQAFLAEHIAHSRFVCIDSPYGHDGFLTEGAQIVDIVLAWLPTPIP